jgi:hypothetical protein
MKQIKSIKTLPKFKRGEITKEIRSLKVGQFFIAPQPKRYSVESAAYRQGITIKREEIEHGLLRITRTR